jgi:hypothetical protein
MRPRVKELLFVLSAVAFMVAVVALLVLLRPAPPEQTGPAAAPATAASTPLTGPAWVALSDAPSSPAADGEETLGVWVPVGADQPRPVVVVLDAASREDAASLGARLYDRLEHDVFVIGWSGSPSGTKRALRAGLERLKERFGHHVAPGSVLLVASQAYGAQAAGLLRQDPAFFSRGLLLDFDPAVWSSTLSVVFGQRGGKRLVFAVSDAALQEGALQAATGVRRTGAETRVVSAPAGTAPSPSAGATALTPPAVYPRQALVEAALGELGWLLEGDARFPHLRSEPGAARKPDLPNAGH